MTPNELEFAKHNAKNYCLFRVYRYDKRNNSGQFFKIEGSLEEFCTLVPTQYRAKIAKE